MPRLDHYTFVGWFNHTLTVRQTSRASSLVYAIGAELQRIAQAVESGQPKLLAMTMS